MEPGTDFRINIYYFTLGVKLYIITCLYLAMSMAINGGIILSEQDLLDALIL